MLSRLVSRLSLIGVVALGAITLNCGGSSSSGNGGGPLSVVGNWQANFSPNIGNSPSGLGAINSSGLAAFLDPFGDIVKLPTITGAKSFSGSLTTYAVNGTFFSDGSSVMTDNSQGTLNAATSITGSFTSSTNPSGTFSVGPFSPLSGSVVPLSGAMNGKVLGFVDSSNFTFAADGSFTGTDFPNPVSPGCSIAGTIVQEKPNNVFDVTFSNVAGNCLTDTDTGIGFESKTDYFNVNGGTDATYLYVMMLTSTLPQVHPFVLVVYQ